MTFAPKLKKWDTIWIVVPSWPCTSEKYEEVLKFTQYIESIWLFVRLADDFLKSDTFQTSWGTPRQRATDVNNFIKDSSISVIWCLQWWDTINQIIDLIDYELLRKNPKIIIWKSDIDVLHNVIYKKIWLITFHGPDSKIGNKWEMELKYTQRSFIARLYKWEKDIISSDSRQRYFLKHWKARWKIIGCNLNSILKLAGTEYFPNFSDDYIFFVETYKDNPKWLTAKLEQLKMLRVFHRCRGMVIGSNYWFDERLGKAEDVILDYFQDYDIPIIKTNEFGHYQPHAFLPIWAEVMIDTESLEIKIESEFLI